MIVALSDQVARAIAAVAGVGIGFAARDILKAYTAPHPAPDPSTTTQTDAMSIATLKAKVGTLTTSLAAILDDKRQADAAVATQTKRADDAEAQVAALTAANAGLSAQVAAASAANADTDAAVAELEAEVDDAVAKLNATTAPATDAPAASATPTA